MMVGVSNDSMLVRQRLLYSSSVKQFFARADLLRYTASLTPSRGILSGAPGVGKFTAAQLYLSWVQQEQQTDHVACALITLFPYLTMREMMQSITQQVSGSSQKPSSSLQHARQRAAEVILEFQMHLLILDNAEYLIQQHLELLGTLFKDLPCALLLICQDRMLELLKRVLSFVDRVGIQQRFPSLTQEEVLLDVLPHLVLPGWSFDSHKEDDLLLGQHIWTAVSPSLYRLVLTLEYAHQVAQTWGKTRISHEIVDHTLHMMGSPVQNSTPLPEWEKKEKE